jgi:hypothetical protein
VGIEPLLLVLLNFSPNKLVSPFSLLLFNLLLSDFSDRSGRAVEDSSKVALCRSDELSI